ncbi:MAG: hypothetical protein JW791_01555 [Nanoarchaeota archaeon]|nr:hypothetical protein [Nanoarchaeota archaeon]
MLREEFVQRFLEYSAKTAKLSKENSDFPDPQIIPYSLAFKKEIKDYFKDKITDVRPVIERVIKEISKVDFSKEISDYDYLRVETLVNLSLKNLLFKTYNSLDCNILVDEEKVKNALFLEEVIANNKEVDDEVLNNLGFKNLPSLVKTLSSYAITADIPETAKDHVVNIAGLTLFSSFIGMFASIPFFVYAYIKNALTYECSRDSLGVFGCHPTPETIPLNNFLAATEPGPTILLTSAVALFASGLIMAALAKNMKKDKFLVSAAKVYANKNN